MFIIKRNKIELIWVINFMNYFSYHYVIKLINIKIFYEDLIKYIVFIKNIGDNFYPITLFNIRDDTS